MKLFFYLLSINLIIAHTYAQDPMRVLLILAHYDDETIASSILSRLQEKNAFIEAIYLTKGEGGSDIRKFSNPAATAAEEALKKTELFAQREREMAKASKILNISKVYQLDMGDVPLRIPEAGYPNPAGRPSTSLKQFMDAQVWDIGVLKDKIKTLVSTNAIKPDYILTLSDDVGVIHSHHQVANYITNSLNQQRVFGDQVKGVYGMVESQWYDMKRFPFKSSALYYNVRAGRTINSPDKRQIDNAFKAYRAHVSQSPSKKTLAELEKIPEILYGLPDPRTGKAYDLQEFSKIIDNSIIRKFANQKDWVEFHKSPVPWQLICSPLSDFLRKN